MTTQVAVTSIYRVTSNILHLITTELQAGFTKAHLAQLRQSINRDVHRALGVFPVVFANIPDQYLGESGYLTAGEQAIVLALQLFALHQQGREDHVHLWHDPKEEKARSNLGVSLSALRVRDDSQAADRRFNAMISATSLNELSNHLRHLIKLLKSRQKDAKVDYAQLAQDLYWFQRGFQTDIRLKWSRSYYRRYNEQKGEESNDK